MTKNEPALENYFFNYSNVNQRKGKKSMFDHLTWLKQYTKLVVFQNTEKLRLFSA